MLLLPAGVRADLERWVRAGYPHETCGLLVGRERLGVMRVQRALEARNLAMDLGQSFELDPGTHLVADREARSQGLAIVGVWHSHPDRPPVPSEADRAAAWKKWSYLILSIGVLPSGSVGLGGVRSWRLVRGVFEEEEARVVSRLTSGVRAPE